MKMATPDEEIIAIFENVISKISNNVRAMMLELWEIWYQLGVDRETKVKNILKLEAIEKDLQHEVVKETQQKLEVMLVQVDKLKEEAEALSRALSVDISVADFKEDLPVRDYRDLLEAQIEGYRTQLEHREREMERLMEWQRDLSDKLGVSIQELSEEPLPSEEELNRLKAHLDVLQTERDKRAETFLNVQVEIKDIMDKLQIKPQNKFEQCVVTNLSVDFKVTDLNMDRLAKLHQELQEEYAQTNNRVLELRERLTKLWECLEEDQIYRENFLHAHPGCHPQTEAAIREEIKRCDSIKRQKIQVFVANMRTKIKLMWDNIMYSSNQREEFVHYYQDIFSEDTLTLHEMYLEKITKYYEENKEIFDMILTRKNLWLKMTELEARASEPGRYHNRGGQLLKEEKERKTIANNLPKIEAQIRELAAAYETRTGKQFTADGKPLLQLMEDEWEIRKAERHNKLSARKQCLTPTTPLFRSLATSPLGKRNRTAAGLAATGEKNKPPTKRQLITGSATKAVSNFNNNLSALKRSAMTSVKRRISGRLAARAVAEGKGDQVKRKLDMDFRTPKVTVNGNILKHKRTSHGKRRSSGRRSIATPNRTEAQDHLLENTMMTTYTDFKINIIEKQISRSSMAKPPETSPKRGVPKNDLRPSKKTSKMPQADKENMNYLKVHTPKSHITNTPKNNILTTPKNNLMVTPNRLTRSAVKLNCDGFATPRPPFTPKANIQRQNTASNLSPLNATNITRSKSHTQLARVKELPPLI